MTIEDHRNGYVLGRKGQVLLCVWSAFLVGGFSVALWLEPDPRGFGTHQRLGLPQCSFQAIFAIPCPSCGMTTSFSNFTRGNIVASVRANVAGFLLATVCAIQIPWCWVSIYRGRMLWVERPDVALIWLLVMVLGIASVQWAVRVF